MQMVPEIRIICPNGLNVVPKRIEFRHLIAVESPCETCADRATCKFVDKLAVYYFE